MQLCVCYFFQPVSTWKPESSNSFLFQSFSTVIAEIFVRVKFSHSSVRELSYAINFRTARTVSHTLLYVHGFRMLLNFRTFSRKYKKYEIKSRTKISAITVVLTRNCHKYYILLKTRMGDENR